MKRIVLLLLFVGIFTTACDPDWALFPGNEGSAYIVNKTDTDIVFRGYASFSIAICVLSSGKTFPTTSSLD